MNNNGFFVLGICAALLLLIVMAWPFHLGREDILDDCNNYGEVVYKDARYTCFKAPDENKQEQK